jgi:hypothetical protein
VSRRAIITGHCVFQVHLLNAPVFVSNVMNLFRPFLKQKLVNKVTQFRRFVFSV